MSNDLISREELKKALNEIFDTVEVVTFNDIISIIDNAPAVEPFEPEYVGAERLKARQRGYEEGYHNGMKIGKTLNPKTNKGEWLKLKNRSKRSYQRLCSNCYNIAYFIGEGNYPFCPYCKAEMKSEEEARI